MRISGIKFRETLLSQMKDYLDGRITKEEYYNQAEPFYTEYANTYKIHCFTSALWIKFQTLVCFILMSLGLLQK